MGLSYLADSSVQECIDDLISRNESFIGLVIGQMQFSSSKDLIVRLVPTPSVPCDDTVETSAKKFLSVDSIDDSYIANHARQALRMLTGGFDIIGVFACINPDEVKSIQAKLRQVLFSVHKTLSKVDCLIGSYAHTDRLLLQVCRLTKKLTCRTFDVVDHKSAGNPCELKFQKVVDSFYQLQTAFSVDFTIPVPTDMMNSSLQKQILNGLQPVFNGISSSIATVNGRLLPDTESLCYKPVGGAKGKRQQTSEIDQQSEPLLIELLQESLLSDVSNTSLFGCGAKMIVRGTVASKAYATAKSTVADSVQMLKKDIVRSIVARCELLCEDLLQAEEEQDVKILYETPLRVFVVLPSHEPVQFCDYLFPDETADDSGERFRDLLGFLVNSDDMDTETEHIPSDSDLDKPKKPVRTVPNSSNSQFQPTSGRHMFQYIGMASTAALASLAALISYWYSASSDLM